MTNAPENVGRCMQSDHIVLTGARTHNLRGVDCKIPHGQMTVVTGVSGSGKSSLAFDTLYAEGQRRYTESLSTYARQFLQRMAKPPFRELKYIRPAVALRQKNEISNARSTVSTVTEIDDHLGLLFTHAGVTHCPECASLVRRDTVSSVISALNALEEGTRLVVTARVSVENREHRAHVLRQHVQDGFRRLYVDGETVDISDDDVERLLDSDAFVFVIDRVVVKPDALERMTEAVEVAMGVGKGRIEVFEHKSDEPPLIYDRAFRCNNCDYDLIEPQPALFSFNSSIGACPHCNGFGRTVGLDFGKIIPNPNETLEGGAVVAFSTPKYKKWQTKMLSACRGEGIAIDVPFRKLPRDAQNFVKSGGKGWKGIRGVFKELKTKTHKIHVRIFLAKYRGFDECGECLGSRLSADARATTIGGKDLAAVWDMRIEEARAFFNEIKLDTTSFAKVETVLEEVRHRLAYLDDVGLGYLELKRPSRTLSGGEMQRIHLTTNLGRALTDTLYVLDEPTAGLHARDSERLLRILHHLRDLGNTVVVVEHDPEIIEGGDWILELGPKGGENGGELTFEGDIKSFLTSDTITGGSLRERLTVPHKSAPTKDFVTIVGASQHNLDAIDVKIPTGLLTAITGVSGSGKSTLMHSVLYNGWRASAGHGGVEKGAVQELRGLEAFEEIVMMDQSALGRSSRSNPLSYTKGYDDVRKIYAETKQAQLAGITARDFSFNTPGGRCETCQGLGVVTVEMHFMADIDVVCDDCNGKRFNDNVLAIEYRGKTISDVFHMTVQEGLEFFGNSRPLKRKLKPLVDVGLGYLRLGQTTSTLSGGEAQRLKLATYIAQGSKKNTKPSFFIFDEPTVGLHLKDVETLLKALHKLIEQGHSVAVIEHNIDFIANCDHVIDLGPGAGPEGGQVVATGTPKEVSQVADSVTGVYLSEFFAG